MCLLHSFYGHDHPRKFVSTGDTLFVYFFTGYCVSFLDFRAEYNSIKGKKDEVI